MTYRVNEFEGLVDLLSHFGSGKDNLAGDEDEQDDLRLHHTIDETGEEFRLVGAEHVMAASKTLQSDGELDVARANNVLNLEVLRCMSVKA